MAVRSAQRKKNQSIFPDFPRHSPMVDQSGRLSAVWHLSLSSLYQALQSVFSNEGYLIPPLSIDDQAIIESIYTPLIGKTLQSTNPATPNISGQLIYSIGKGHLSPPPPGIPDVGYVAPALKVFIIYFENPEDPTSKILNASWKTVTVT